MSLIPEITQLAKDLRAGNRVALAKAITLVESTKEEHQLASEKLLELCASALVKSKRIGITGVPGVGKSTFIDAFGSLLTSQGHKVAVLAVDPSSDLSRGSILGDKTRMERLSYDSNAFIRPTPSSGSLGGVARKTRETIALCEAAGFDTILVETVGVGQSETTVHSMVDMFVLLVLATAGDELQGIKRGIMEMADLVIINKDDGQNATFSKLAAANYRQALHLLPEKENEWTVPVLSCSSINGNGVQEVLLSIEDFFVQSELKGSILKNRSEQNGYWLKQSIADELSLFFYSDPTVKKEMEVLLRSVKAGKKNPFSAARDLVRNWRYRS